MSCPCQAAPLGHTHRAGQRGRLRGFRRSQVFPSVKKNPNKTSTSDLFPTSTALEGGKISKYNGDFFHNGLFPPKTRLVIRSPGISSCGGHKGSYSDIALNGIQVLEVCKGFSEAQRAALFPLDSSTEDI